MQYTVEARRLTNKSTHGPSHDGELRQRTIEAEDGAAALYQFVKEEASELVSITRAGNAHGESIATVKKEEAVFLVRVYTT